MIHITHVNPRSYPHYPPTQSNATTNSSSSGISSYWEYGWWLRCHAAFTSSSVCIGELWCGDCPLVDGEGSECSPSCREGNMEDLWRGMMKKRKLLDSHRVSTKGDWPTEGNQCISSCFVSEGSKYNVVFTELTLKRKSVRNCGEMDEIHTSSIEEPALLARNFLKVSKLPLVGNPLI